MTPAVRLAIKNGTTHRIHSYKHDKSAISYGREAAEKLGIDPTQVYKTLIVELENGQLACAIVPVAGTLNLKRTAKILGAKKVGMANQDKVEASTGYVLGGISPIAQKRALPCIIDISAQDQESIYVSAGKRGLEIELAPHDLAMLTHATFANIQD